MLIKHHEKVICIMICRASVFVFVFLHIVHFFIRGILTAGPSVFFHLVVSMLHHTFIQRCLDGDNHDHNDHDDGYTDHDKWWRKELLTELTTKTSSLGLLTAACNDLPRLWLRYPQRWRRQHYQRNNHHHNQHPNMLEQVCGGYGWWNGCIAQHLLSWEVEVLFHVKHFHNNLFI